eukprot:TRINITY_DN27263_c0_g1_i1.p1 TRINITY_DN27263_c0_g1~~TRINITY_DN27263_c0_g1_i1.p1  ORF type:complete len:325 (+),score=50.49 TRINITY_DN27263_c0_g1_i1:38-1012(+)
MRLATIAPLLDKMEKPRASYVGTAVFGLLLFACWTTSFVIQVLWALLTSPLLLCGHRERFHHMQSYIWRTMNALIVTLNPFWRVSLHRAGQDIEFQADEGCPGTVIVINHRSNMDPWVTAWVQAKLCVEARYIYKSTLGKIPIVGWLLCLAGDLAAHFGKKERITEMLDRSREVLEDGYNIAVFPEGTRSPSGILQDFKPTFFDIAAEVGCNVVPVCLFGTERAWPHGGFKMGCADIIAIVGSPITPSNAAGGGEQLKAAVLDSFSRLAAHGLSEGLVESDDPMITGRPYPWWQPPEELEDMGEAELLALLRSGKAHARGQNLA